MSNILEKIGSDVLHAVEYPFEYTAKAIKILDTAIVDSPEIKQAVIQLIKQAETVISDIPEDIATKGLNFQSDAKTLADTEAFFAYFKNTFCPLVEQLYGQVIADIK